MWIKVLVLLLSVAILGSTGVPKPYKYLGCYVNAPLNHSANGHGTIMSIAVCEVLCRKLSFWHYRSSLKYFGLKDGNECYCDKALYKFDKVGDSRCNVKCAGNDKQKCGGSSSMAVYEIKLNERDVSYKYLGCYLEAPLFSYNANWNSTYLTMKVCQALCRKQSLKYFAFKAGDQCYCGKSLKNSVKIKDSHCSVKKCFGTNMCGGPRSMAVHEINPYVSKNYKGCYWMPDTNSKELSIRGLVSDEIMTPEICREDCIRRKTLLYGVFKRIHCFCGNATRSSRPPLRLDLLRSTCLGVCPGDKQKVQCGGRRGIQISMV